MVGFNRILNCIAGVTGWIALLFLGFMMLAITIDVVARALMGRAVPWLFEMSELSMVMVVFMGLGLTLIDDAHIRVTMLTDRLPHEWSRIATGISRFFAALTFAMLAGRHPLRQPTRYRSGSSAGAPSRCQSGGRK